MRRLVSLVLALAFIPVASGATLPSPCTLLTNAQVAKVLGSKVAYRTAGAGYCTWNGMALGAFTSAHSILMVAIARSTKAAFKATEAARRGAVRVRGVGQAAFGTPESNVVFLIVWQRGVVLSLVASSVSTPLDVEEAAAKIALEHF